MQPLNLKPQKKLLDIGHVAFLVVLGFFSSPVRKILRTWRKAQFRQEHRIEIAIEEQFACTVYMEPIH